MDHLLCEESEALKVKSSELCPALTVLQLQKEHHEPQDLNSPYPEDSPWSERYQTPYSKPHTLPLIPVDPSYKELPCPGIQNPTYNMTLMAAADNVLVSGYMPQT